MYEYLELLLDEVELEVEVEVVVVESSPEEAKIVSNAVVSPVL